MRSFLKSKAILFIISLFFIVKPPAISAQIPDFFNFGQSGVAQPIIFKLFSFTLRDDAAPTSPSIPPPAGVPTSPAAGGPTTVPTIPPTLPPSSSLPTPTQKPPPTNPPPASDPLRQIVSAVSEQNLRNYLQNLVDDDNISGSDELQNRRSGSSGNNTEADFIKSQLESFGLVVEKQRFSVGGVPTHNIIGRIAGSKTDEDYLVTAHMDAIASDSPASGPAPGADDNGSGAVAVMETARVLKQQAQNYNYSLEFILFSGEEQGLLGSKYYVANIPPGKKIKGIINLDMVANRGSAGDCVNFGYKPYNGGNVLSDAIVKNNNDYAIGLITKSHETSERRSDHAPFWDAGIAAIMGHECNFSSVYHSTSDKTDKINFTQLTKTTKAVAATLAQFALRQ